MSTDPAQPDSTPGATGANDGHQDVGGQDESIPTPQLDPTTVNVSDIVEATPPAGGETDANA